MGIFGRIGDIIKANINDLLDKAEDPVKMIKQMVIDMQEAVTKATSGLAQAMAQEKKLQRDYEKFVAMSKEWENKAMAALQAGNEDLARKALAKKAEADQQANMYKQMYEQAAQTAATLKTQVEQLKAKLDEARMKESTLIARSQAAKAQKEIAKNIGTFDHSSISAKFSKFEEKILKEEAEAQAFTQLSEGTTSLDDEFKALEKNMAVDDELAKLKAKLGK
ncbi:PspA/IM30 family protein [Raineya orbicola]|jgi:phage shock protein A|uniref:Phage shock protein A (IM30) suppresses sigma54-dependent transcription n=1 Tax=Raineya orbicola TaxID=2016530 RepID=A0A2N3IG39_9BACT|nr:PspA/IM30 family protein [Raineya orbicola]PKQ69261.1 Phage shock protein A (IM30) suppresses sigma54-dependent transcription [Raineya orbicola]